MSRDEEHLEKLQKKITALTKQRRALLNQARRKQGELIHLREEIESLTAMVKGHAKNEYDPLDIRFTDGTYRRRQRAERVLKQTKLLHIPPDCRVTHVDSTE